jgi:hypothetical protein
MNKSYLVVGLILISVLVVGGAYYLSTKSSKGYNSNNSNQAQQTVQKSQQPAKENSISIKGTKLADNQMLGPHSYLIYPLTDGMSAEAKAALTGWKVTTVKKTDGSAMITLAPDNTEQEDHKQEFTVLKGQKLYFVELNLQDDQNGQDYKWIDDVGILTDENDVILNELPKPPQGEMQPAK